MISSNMIRFPLLIGFAFSSCTNLFSQDSIRGAIVSTSRPDSTGINYALVVGISSYANITSLLYADDDAELFASFLINEKICEKKNLIKLIDSSATTANFYKELTRLKNKVVANDRVFIYFAGHGDVETDLESGFLLTYNCEANNYPATAIDISMLEKYVTAFVNKNAKIVLITDACRSGNLAGGLNGTATTMNAISKHFQNATKILSCQPHQLSIEKQYPGGGHGVFTYNLVDGLSGIANTDDDSAICLREIASYLDIVRSETNKKQEPKVEGDPDKIIVNFDKAIQSAIVSKKQQSKVIAVNSSQKTRGVEDSTWISNSYYIAFKQQLKKRHYIGDSIRYSSQTKKYTDLPTDNAYYVITEAAARQQPAGLIADMKLELSATLEDEAQKWINKYLRGEFANQSYIFLDQLNDAKNYLMMVEMMMGDTDLRFKEIHVKNLFFGAYIVWKTRHTSMYLHALNELEVANKLVPKQAWLICLMGILEGELKKFRQSEHSFKTAIALAPGWSYPKNNLGLLYIKRKKYRKSEAVFKQALKTDSGSAYLWNNLGTLYSDRKKIWNAESAFNKAIQLDSTYAAPLNNLGKIYKDNKKYLQAEILLKKAIALDADYAVAWFNLGSLYLAQKDVPAARWAFRTAFKIDPHLPIKKEFLVTREAMMD